MDALKKTLSQIKEDLFNDLKSSFKRWNNKSSILIKKGKYTDKLFFVNKGFVLLKIHLNGRQWVRHIAQSGEFITSLSGFESGAYSEETIVAIGEFEVYYIEKSDLQKLRRKSPEIDQIYTNYITNALIACQSRIGDLLCLDAEQYYEKLLREKSSIMSSIPQYELASYLGIRPQSLSRIRVKARQAS